MLSLESFVKSEELVSFQYIKDFAEKIFNDYDEALDFQSQLEDLQAIICIGHACNRLAGDLESVWSIDILSLIHETINLLYMSYNVFSKSITENPDEALDMLMHQSILNIINYASAQAALAQAALA